MPLLRSLRAALHTRAVVVFLLLAGALGCRESTGPVVGGDVASVIVTGAPITTMIVGDSVRLVATPVTATGGIVSGQQVAWSSSAPTVAAVSNNGTVVALGSGTAVITASVDGRDGSASVEVANGGMIGTQGGVLTASNGAAKLEILAGTFPQATLVLIHPATNPPADDRILPKTAYEIGPDGVSFWRAATLTLTFDPANLPSGTVSESLQLYMQSGSGWVVVPQSTVDVAAKTVTGSITRAGVYVVRSTPVDHITLRGATVGGALYVGQTARMQATLYAANGDSLRMRPIAWSSSDPAAVSVDSLGNVRALAIGKATITATSDGKSASTSLTILTRPIANWSGAADWTTFQGNAQHSGHIAATLDPTVFRERWVATPVAGAVFFPPTAGGGRLYLAMSAYFSPQQLVAINPADGSVMWTRDFGSIFGINQPTYDNGSIYIASGGHEDTYMWALDASDGSLRFQTAFESQWEHWKAPVVAGSTIVTAGGYYGGVYGFDRSTGGQTFFLSGPQIDGWAPASANGMIYVTGYVPGGGVSAIDPTNGTVTAAITDSRLPTVTTPVIGNTNDLLTITGNRLVSVDLTAQKVAWEQSGSYTGMPVVGNGVVYGISGTTISARNESDGTLLWNWTPPVPGGTPQTMALTDNILFVSVTGGYNTPGATFAIDLASHMSVWSYPMNGDLALSNQGVLYIVQGSKVAAISVQ